MGVSGSAIIGDWKCIERDCIAVPHSMRDAASNAHGSGCPHPSTPPQAEEGTKLIG